MSDAKPAARVTFAAEPPVASTSGAAGTAGASDGAASSSSAPPGFGLAVQSLESLDISKLTPLTPEVISRQVRVRQWVPELVADKRPASFGPVLDNLYDSREAPLSGNVCTGTTYAL